MPCLQQMALYSLSGMTLLFDMSARLRLASTKRPDSVDRATGSSRPEPLFMDNGGKNQVLSTKMAVFVDGEVGLSTIKAVYVDKWQKKWHPSTYRSDSVDG